MRFNQYTKNYDKHTLYTPIDFTDEKDPELIKEQIQNILIDAHVEKYGKKPTYQIKVVIQKERGYIYVKSTKFYNYLSNPKRIVNGKIVGPELLKLNKMSVEPVKDNHMHNILRCSYLPESISLETVKKVFAEYCSDPITKQTRYIKGTKLNDTYPFVSLDEKRVLFVVFDPETADAQFALLFTSNIRINDIQLNFTHSFKAPKDVLTELKRKKRLLKRYEQVL